MHWKELEADKQLNIQKELNTSISMLEQEVFQVIPPTNICTLSK